MTLTTIAPQSINDIANCFKHHQSVAAQEWMVSNAYQNNRARAPIGV